MREKNGKWYSVIANICIVCMLVGLGTLTFTTYNKSMAVYKADDSPFYKGNTARNEVSLMINVYWGSEYLDGILEVLAKNDARCTFFVGGTWALDNKEYLKKIIDGGHEIGNHGYFHKDHKKLTYTQNKDEIVATNELVKQVAGYDIKLFAPPSGSFGNTTLSVAKELRMPVIMWSKDTVDWRDKDWNVVLQRATKNVESGDLILMHPTAHTLQALPKILKDYKEKNLRAVTVSQIIDSAVI
ncbi:MAG: polysaccharide deacetylase family protein [Clostridia bacterium]